ncbi:MAG: hypothetical protein Q7R41_00960, partial [Phycisphaerales bacterium]|nr:hypothetical protein [Phycisphaerales bacterium]
MNRRIGAVGTISLLMVALAGCPGVPPVPSEPCIPTVISDDLLPDPDGSIILPPGHDALQPCSALVTGNGTHLYVVDDVEVLSDGSLQITTSKGSLAQLGIVGEFRFADPLTQVLPGKFGPQELGLEANLQILQVAMPFSTTIDLTSDGSISATVDGIFELDGLFHLAFDVGLFGGLRTFSSYIGGDAFSTLNALVETQIGANISGEKAVTAPFTTYYAGFIGVVPIAVEVTAQLFVGIEGNVVAGASIETGVDAHADVKVGAGYDSTRAVSSRWSTIATSGFDWTFDQPIICANGSGSLRGYLRPHFEVQLYSVVGPTFDIEPYGRLDASLQGCLGDPAVSYDATLIVGAVGYAKIKADILDLFVLESPRLTVFDVSQELESWHNTTGACCAASGACTATTQSSCSGSYKGDATTCTPGICQQPTGACCVNGSNCNINVSQASCTSQSGVWQGAGSTGCTGCTGRPSTGACCVTGNCNSGVTQTSCTNQGGIWQGTGSTSCQNCSPTGACCVNGSTCNANVTQASCTSQSGVWQGANTTSCQNCSAPPGTGACCVNGNTCNTGVTQANCSGVWQGAGSTTCQNCSPTGACCVNGTTCNANVSQASCTSQSGVWQGAGSTGCTNCTPPPSTGACCINGNTCNTGVTQANCSGVWQGAGSTT